MVLRYCRLFHDLCLSLVLDTLVSPAKTDKPVEMPFKMQTCLGLRNHALDRGCTLTPPAKYDLKICMWQRCELMSNYFGLLFVMSASSNRWAGGIMFLGCPSICVYLQYMHACPCRGIPNLLVVDFWSYLQLIVCMWFS